MPFHRDVGLRAAKSASLLPMVAVLLVAATPAGAQEVPPFSLDDPKSAHAVVAQVGPLKITAREFRLSYEFGPAFAKRSKDSKQQYLGYMINEKLLALDASSRRNEVLPRLSPTLAEIEGDLATEELYKDDVQSKVKVTGAEIGRGIEQSRRHVSLQWIFAPSHLEIDRQATMLRAGVPFDSLYRLQGPDSLLAANRSLESTLFTIRKKNPEIVSVVDTMNPARPSSPIKGTDGWYILRIADGFRDVLLTQSDEMKLHNDVYRALLLQKSDSLSDLYVHALMAKHQPVIVPETFDLVSSYLALKFLEREIARQWELIGPPEGEKDSAIVAGIDNHGKLPLVRLSGETPIPLKTFLTWYRTREALIKLGKTSKQAYLLSIQQMIWQMVRDRLLVERAFKRNLQERSTVQTQKKWWEDKLMFEAEKSLIADSISFHDRVLQAFYEDNRRHYKNPAGAPLTFSDARDDVLRDYYEFELTKRLLHRINALKKKYRININEKALARIPLEEGNPHTIDMYAVKKGGIFPRPAFPAIDMLWRTWN